MLIKMTLMTMSLRPLTEFVMKNRIEPLMNLIISLLFMRTGITAFIQPLITKHYNSTSCITIIYFYKLIKIKDLQRYIIY